jgi:hypothetical protein
MNAFFSLRCAIGFAIFVVASPLMAEGWTLPSLNPFKTEKREVSAYTPPASEDPDLPTSGFKFPKLKLPQAPKMSFGERPPGQPSAMQKLGQGTKNFFSKTADVLTPWDNDEKPAPRSRTATGVRRTYNGSPGAVEEKKTSLFSSWFKKDEPETPKTVNGFLANPRPRF